MTEAQGQPSAWRAWATVVVLLILSTVAWMDRSVISMVIGPLKAHFGVSDLQISFVAGLAFSVFYILFLIPIGSLADRASRRLILFFGVLVWSLATVGFGVASSFSLLLASRMMVGAGEGTVSPVAAATISRLFGRARMAGPMSIYSLGASFGTAAGVAIAGEVLTLGRRVGRFQVPILGSLEPWQFVYVLLGVPGVLAALLAFTIFDPKEHAAPPSAVDAPTTQGVWLFIRRHSGAFGLTVFGFVLVNIAVTSTMTWTPEYLRRHFGQTPAKIGWMIAATSLVGPLIFQLGAGWVVNRLVARGVIDAPLRLMRWLLLAALPFGAGIYFAPTPLAFGFCFFCLMALILASNPLGITAVQLIAPPDLRSSLAAVHLAVLGVVGIGFGSSITAAISQYLLHDHALGAALALTVVVALLFAIALLRFAEPKVSRLIRAQADAQAPTLRAAPSSEPPLATAALQI